MINAVRVAEGGQASTVEALVREGAISYITFPPALLGKYQS